MPFELRYETIDGRSENIKLEIGDSLFVLGANGTGKSSLLLQFYAANRPNARKISAHRQTWFSSNTIDISPDSKRKTEKNMASRDADRDSRWKDDYSSQRSSIAIYDLLDAENIRAREIAAAVDDSNLQLAAFIAKRDAPIKIINEILRLSNIPVVIEVAPNERVMARRNGGQPYSIAELSDGERNALLIAASVLTSKPGTLLLIDEPERHLHRSIISPLLTLLFKRRNDCTFIVSTHDLGLVSDNVESKVLLVRSCVFSESQVISWEADLVPSDSDVDEALKLDIMGARRKIIFVEGSEQSLDSPLYSVIFPMVSIIPKSSSRNVEQAVKGLRNSSGLHWLKAWGIIDNDGRGMEEIASLQAEGVHPLPIHSVESIYYHPVVFSRASARHCAVVGGVSSELVANAIRCGLALVTPHVKRLSCRVIEKHIRARIMEELPSFKDLLSKTSIEIKLDIECLISAEVDRFNEIVNRGDLFGIIVRYPVRETPVLDEIAKIIGFQNRKQYQQAVIKMLMEDGDILTYVQSLFGSLISEATGDLDDSIYARPKSGVAH